MYLAPHFLSRVPSTAAQVLADMQAVLQSRACRTAFAQPHSGRRRVSRLSFGRGLCFRTLAAAVKEKTELFSDLELACKEFKRAPPSEVQTTDLHKPLDK